MDSAEKQKRIAEAEHRYRAVKTKRDAKFDSKLNTPRIRARIKGE